MIEIKGKVNTAICYAAVVEDEAIEQIRRMCDHEFTAGSQIRIMPDVHAGKGCTIGTTMTITDKAVPNIVGVDIGCGRRGKRSPPFRRATGRRQSAGRWRPSKGIAVSQLRSGRCSGRN